MTKYKSNKEDVSLFSSIKVSNVPPLPPLWILWWWDLRPASFMLKEKLTSYGMNDNIYNVFTARLNISWTLIITPNLLACHTTTFFMQKITLCGLHTCIQGCWTAIFFTISLCKKKTYITYWDIFSIFITQYQICKSERK